MSSGTGGSSGLDGHPLLYERHTSPHIFHSINRDQTVEAESHPTEDATGLVMSIGVAKGPLAEGQQHGGHRLPGERPDWLTVHYDGQRRSLFTGLV